MFVYNSSFSNSTLDLPLPEGAAGREVQVLCCACKEVDVLKVQKLKLQIKLLKRKLGEE